MSSVELSEIVRNWVLVLAAVAGVGIAVWRAFAADQQARAQRESVYQTRREHVATLFGEAVRQLDDDKLHVRLGAIFSLREIVEAFPELSRPTVDLLAAYLSSVEYAGDEPPRDVAEIIAIVVPTTDG